ncbi:MAG: YajD family HNH nuclease [Deltaproteobacteria bacterium]|nr:YajD family HNH nuclease [Deltaproteobacteria bacterium]
MTPKKPQTQGDKLDKIIAEARRYQESREITYREQALKMFPWICGRCGREFSGKRLRELTVHHKDHNHENNPPDGSNWELLCIYCHDMEHQRYLEEEGYDEAGRSQDAASSYRPFACLEALLKDKK